ncbi:hypothetical protein [Amycolatopsis sp. NPDC098790]|uniref:hypothetical protein n=1 Tax=Amycolatopsis sp. NPDC098790 TaxID=3363939 RepID=UPI00381DBB58
MKSVVWWSVGLLFGLGFMALGLFGSGEPSGKVLCGSEEMRPGQTCDRTQYGQTTSETYEEKRQEAIDDAATFKGGGRWVTFGIGTAIAAACGWRLVVAVRRRSGAGSVAQAVPGQQPGFGPPPGYPAQDHPVQTYPAQAFSAQSSPVQGYPPHGHPAQQDLRQQPGFAPAQGFPPPQGVQQPPGYQPPRGPHQQ